MKLAIAQINPRLGDVTSNLRLLLENIAIAKTSGADLIVFPELSVLGYPARDLIVYSHIVDENLKALEKIKQESLGITIVVGYVEPNSSAFGKPFFNSAAVFQNGNKIANYRKWLLPYYDVFEEERYFEPGLETSVIEVRGQKIGISICEDVWNEPGFLPRMYQKDPVQSYSSQKLDLLLNLSASPFEIGKRKKRELVFRRVADKIKAPVVFCNQVGANDELIFDGGSFVVSSQGKKTQAKEFQTQLLIWDSNGKSEVRLCELAETDSKLLTEALALGIRDYVEKTPAKTVCLGLSGGIDSSVVAALAVRALGSKRVFGFALPSRFNASQSLEDAQKLASNLGISCQALSIETIFEAFQKEWKRSIATEPKTLTLENIQPRIRMALLMALANESGHLLLNTSNKSEILSGYATLYGDTAGAISVLGDLTKQQVYALADEFNSEKEIIPRRIITRAPSAELRENQTDQDTLPPYEILDFLVQEHVEQERPLSSISGKGITAGVIQKVSKLSTVSEYKRRQAPPILRVTCKAFGIGRRIPVVGRKPSE
ncbi:MAG: NAD+ synthase [Deltaproteobacteria bacterium]|nr:NAD+ synthase [Deltaproteobacteria bacterium]